LKDC